MTLIYLIRDTMLLKKGTDLFSPVPHFSSCNNLFGGRTRAKYNR